MPFTKFTNLDFDQIKESIKDYLRANSTFKDFDFEGSNFAVLIDALAYNTYITAFNSNMVVNESFLDSATIRENVVSLARNIGYVPRSRNASTSVISLSVTVPPEEVDEYNTPIRWTPTVTLQAGLVCIGSAKNTSYVFSISGNISANVVNGTANFNNIEIKEGTFLKKEFSVDGSLDQRFILDNSFIDTSTIRVYVKGVSDPGLGKAYKLVDNILNINNRSEIYLIQEVQDEKYELLFGDGIFGKKLQNGSVITVTYIVTGGKDGNGASSFSFSGSLIDAKNDIIIPNTTQITTVVESQNGSEIEPLDSIKHFAPRLYSSQYRTVTSNDYAAIIKSKIYPNAESISVIGGEELEPPQYGRVLISIKPKNGTFVSDFDKLQIKNRLKQYMIAGINPEIIDLKILYVEIDSSIYYNNSRIANANDLRTRIVNSLNKYANSADLNAFGSRFRYSKILQLIDSTDPAVTSNITKVRMRRDLKALLNSPTQYEICFGNRFHVNPQGKNIKSTGFHIFGEERTVYLTDFPNKNLKTGIISLIKEVPTLSDDGEELLVVRTVQKALGTVNYVKGEIQIGTINIVSTSLPQNIIEIQAFPESNDIIGLKDIYLSFSIDKSEINMVKDVIASGDDVSGVVFSSSDYFRSSYSNGQIKRS